MKLYLRLKMEQSINKSNFIITIITVSYNAKFVIEETIKSVLLQSYASLEYIVLDGDSNDGTLDIIAKYVDYISYFECQKDDGLYFAMNKGISLAHGDYILFLNCGDSLYDRNVIQDLVIYLSRQDKLPDVIYGNIVQKRGFGDLLVKPLPLERICRQMVFSHQACFVRRSVLNSNLFNTEFRFIADYNQLSLLYLNGYSFKYIDRIISRIEIDAGVSFENKALCFKELMKIDRAPFVSYSSLGFLKYNILEKMRLLIKDLLPSSLLNKYYRYKYGNRIL